METVRLGAINNVMVSFDISHYLGVEDMDCLDITISSRIDTDFVCKTTINGITSKDIDQMCYRLQSLKRQIEKEPQPR